MGWAFLARVFMTVRECLITNHAQELQEETLADLHHCLDQLSDRHAEMDEKKNVCVQRAMAHFQSSKSMVSTFDSSRELTKAKQFLQEKRRLQMECEKIHNNILVIQQQIDAIISSQLNLSVVEAMKQFNVNAVKLSIPAQTYDIENLEEQLAERASEISGMRQAMDKMTCALSNDDSEMSDEADILVELQSYFSSDTDVLKNEPLVSSAVNKARPVSDVKVEVQPQSILHVEDLQADTGVSHKPQDTVLNSILLISDEKINEEVMESAVRA